MKIELFYNSFKARRYFSALKTGLSDFQVRLGPTGLGISPRPSQADLDWIIEFSLAQRLVGTGFDPRTLGGYRAGLIRLAACHYAWARHRITRTVPDLVGVWGGQKLATRAVRVAARDQDVPCVIFERGLLPRTTTADFSGVNAENSVPRDPEVFSQYHQNAELPEQIPPRVQPAGEPEELPERFFFVPFQVARDSQILLYSPWIRDMQQLYWLMEGVCRDLPDDVSVVFKTHPACDRKYENLRAYAAESARARFVDNHTTAELIRRSIGVVTVNSSVGIETLILGKPVVCLGSSCYAVPGVASHAESPGALMNWLKAVCENREPSQSLRLPFLNWLSNEYVIPDSHLQPGERHMARITQLLNNRVLLRRSSLSSA